MEQWLLIGLVIGAALKPLTHWSWPAAVLSGIGLAFLAVVALGVVLVHLASY